MDLSLAAIVSDVLELLAFLGIVFAAISLWAARAFVRDSRRAGLMESASLPPVSVLKPLKGLDPGLLAALETQCRQQYPGQWEILFGLSDLDDPAAEVIAELQRRFPEQPLRVVHCPLTLGSNGKISNCAQMLPHARFEHVLIADGDISVGPQYLRRVMEPFLRDGKVGLVTVPYRGRAHRAAGAHGPTLGARLEVLAIATDFFPGVLTARWLEGGIRFGLGSTLATTKTALERIGGLAPLAAYLGDDYELGARVSAAGMRVELVGEVVETAVAPYTLGGFWEHQMRWARSVRDSRPLGYLGLLATYPLPWALLAAVASGGSLASLALLSLAVLARLSAALMVGGGLLGDRAVVRDVWLVPLRDCVGLLLWAWSYAGDTVVWRGERMRVRGGRLLREEGGSGERLA
jgi:ceramide glucosyltransferase